MHSGLWKTKVGTRRTFNRGAKLCSFVEFLDLHGQVDRDLGIKNPPYLPSRKAPGWVRNARIGL